MLGAAWTWVSWSSCHQERESGQVWHFENPGVDPKSPDDDVPVVKIEIVDTTPVHEGGADSWRTNTTPVPEKSITDEISIHFI